ncbi:hypothetical protein OROMI_017427 [Orobanche minor]
MLDVSGRRPTKRRRTESPSGATLPMDLWTNILARVGSTSLVDVFNAKLVGVSERQSTAILFTEKFLWRFCPGFYGNIWKIDAIWHSWIDVLPHIILDQYSGVDCDCDLEGGLESLILASQLGEANLVHGMIIISGGLLFQEQGLQILNARH